MRDYFDSYALITQTNIVITTSKHHISREKAQKVFMIVRYIEKITTIQQNKLLKSDYGQLHSKT